MSMPRRTASSLRIQRSLARDNDVGLESFKRFDDSAAVLILLKPAANVGVLVQFVAKPDAFDREAGRVVGQSLHLSVAGVRDRRTIGVEYDVSATRERASQLNGESMPGVVVEEDAHIVEFGYLRRQGRVETGGKGRPMVGHQSSSE